MQQIRVNKAELLATLEQNRVDHQVIFQEAVEGYRTQALAELEEKIESLRTGDVLKDITFRRTAPKDYTREYDRAIAMIKMSVDEYVVLEEDDFAKYVQDDWNWQGAFLSNVYGSARARGKFADSYAVS